MCRRRVFIALWSGKFPTCQPPRAALSTSHSSWTPFSLIKCRKTASAIGDLHIFPVGDVKYVIKRDYNGKLDIIPKHTNRTFFDIIYFIKILKNLDEYILRLIFSKFNVKIWRFYLFDERGIFCRLFNLITQF